MSVEELSPVDWLRFEGGCTRLLRLVKLGCARFDKLGCDRFDKVGWARFDKVGKVGGARLFPRFAPLIITGSWAASRCRASSLMNSS